MVLSIMDSHGFNRNEGSVRKNIRVSIHPHELILSEEEMKNDEEILCRWCLDQVKDANYSCKDCSFFLHESCAVDIPKGWRSHNWTSIKENEDGRYKCCRCGEIVSAAAAAADSPPCYVCRTCKVFVHKSCETNLSSEVRHTLHRKHPLFLLPNCKWNATYSAFVYYCNCCTFALDMKAALQEKPLCLREPENQEHQFTPLMRSEYSSLCCDACGLKFEQFGSSGPFLCTICHIVVHDECTSLPQTINILHHNHPLTFTFFFLLKQEDMPHVDQFNCRPCHTKINKDVGGYYCAGCRFATHVGCAYKNLISTNNPTLQHADQDAIVDLFMKIEMTEDELAVEIEHFSHEHKLSRGDNEIEDKCCDACIRPISHPFYRCVECEFFLHKSCIELPNQITHIFHDHPLTLLPSAPGDNGTFRCSLCSNDCHGFVYSCEVCRKFYVDVRCASIPPSFRHPGHDHRLSFTHTNRYDTRCGSCSSGGKDLFLCTECPFGIDYRCATLPSTAIDWFHEHPLVLTYRTVDDGSDAYYCDICEKERNPKHWYYYCAQCDYAAHPDCARGKYPYLLPGRLYNITRPFFIIQGCDFEHRINLCSECHSLPLFPITIIGDKSHKHDLVLEHSFMTKRLCNICREILYGGSFRCKICHFEAHSKCVLRRPITVPRRQMSLSIVRRTSWGCIPCMVCDEDCRDACLKCPKVECTFCVHFYCALSLFRF